MSMETSPSRKVVQDWLVNYIASVVDLPVESVKTDVPFRELGVDSAEVVIMTGVMEEEFALELKSDLPFEHPTVAGFLDALEQQGVVSAQ